MTKSTLAKIVSIYSIVYGGLLVFSAIYVLLDDDGPFSLWISVFLGLAFLILGIIGIVKITASPDRGDEKGIIISLFTLYCITQFAVLVLLLTLISTGIVELLYVILICESLVVLPFIFSIMYLNKISDKESMTLGYNKVNNDNNYYVTENIKELKKLKDMGYINEEQYNKFVDKLIGD